MLVKPLRLPACLCLVALAVGCGSEPSAAEYLEQARTHEREGELRTASIAVRNALKGDSENAAARLLLGDLQLRSGDPVGAEKELSRARELGAEDADVVPHLALALLRQDKFDELKALDGNDLSPKGEASLLASRAFAYLVDDEVGKARQEAERALELDPSATDAQLVLVRLDAMAGDVVEAGERLRETLEADPASIAGWELLGDIERAAGRPEEAVAAYDEAIEGSNRAFGARLKRAQLKLAGGDDDAALADLDTLSKAGIELPDIEFARGRIDLRKGELSDAQVRFENVLKEAPGYAPALGGLAMIHLASGNMGQAEQYGKQMMASTNASDGARRLLGAIRLENGRYELAAETVEPMLRVGGSGDPFASRLMSTALLKQDRYDEAIGRMSALSFSLPTEPSEAVDSPLVFARAPSEELLSEAVGGARAVEREPGEDFLDENDRRIARVLELLGRGRNEEALKEAEALVTSMPDSAVPHNLVGQVHASAGRLERARAAFERALAIDERNVAALRFLAELDLRDGDADAARARLEAALLGEGDVETVLLALAQLEAREGDEPAMLDWLGRARSDYPDSAASTLMLAQYRASRAEHASALEALEQLTEQQRRGVAALQLEGVSLNALRRHDEALERFDALVALQPNSPQWHYLRAQAMAGMNDREATVEALERALELSPEHVPSLLAMTNIELLRRDFEPAEARIDTLRDLIAGRPELDAVVTRLAEAKETADGAEPDDDIQGRLRIDSTQGALEAARKLYSRGEPEQATDLLETWLEANPTDIAVRLTLANTYGAREREDDAIAQYETLLEDDEEALPEQVRLAALNNLAWYLREKDPTRAVDYAERALDVTPDSVATLDTLAMIHFGQGDNAAAKAAFDRASAIGIENPTIRFHGARIEAALGNDAAARALLEPLVDSGTEFPEAEAAARLLEEIGRSSD